MLNENLHIMTNKAHLVGKGASIKTLYLILDVCITSITFKFVLITVKYIFDSKYFLIFIQIGSSNKKCGIGYYMDNSRISASAVVLDTFLWTPCFVLRVCAVVTLLLSIFSKYSSTNFSKAAISSRAV